MQDIYAVTREILGCRISPDFSEEEEIGLIHDFFSFDSLYIVASPDTTPDAWITHMFTVHIKDKAIRLYIDKDSAELYAETIHAVLPDGSLMVDALSPNAIRALIADDIKTQKIEHVWLCGKSPIRASTNKIQTVLEAPSEIVGKDADAEVLDEITVDPDTIKPIWKCLDAADAKTRRELDPGKHYENFYMMLEGLIYKNGIDLTALDYKLGMQPGYTKMMIKNPLRSDMPKKIMMDYLAFFSLSGYLYCYKAQSSEIANELKENPLLDCYAIKKANFKTPVPFKLAQIQRGIDQNKAYVYLLKFESKNGPFECNSSTIFGLIKGNEYAIEGLSDVVSQNDINQGVSSAVLDLPSEADITGVLEDLKKREPKISASYKERNKGGNRYIEETDDEKYEREKREVLGWIIKGKRVGEKEGRKIMAPFDDDEEVIAAFAEYIKTHRMNSPLNKKLDRFGYTPSILAHDLLYEPVEVYAIMSELRRKPKETKQLLKYRVADIKAQREKRP
ncbi:MAG: hypothetical protein HFF17_13515 [Oscillospiraceae bacterium]|nr:hypothetical protein [Oscillospiraceae bacterium]